MKKYGHGLIYGLILGSALLMSPILYASHTEQHLRVENMDVYLGVVPSELTQHHEILHSDSTDQPNKYHVLVALFDSSNGQRITDAKVKAYVAPLELAGVRKDLKPMVDGGLQTYGNYFLMPKSELYRIKLDIRPAGSKEALQGNFVYQRPMN